MKLPDGTDNTHSYTQSSVYSYNNTGDGDPKVYEAHKSKLTAPGGVSTASERGWGVDIGTGSGRGGGHWYCSWWGEYCFWESGGGGVLY